MNPNEIAELVSLALTASVMVVGLVALRIYCPDLRKFFSQATNPTIILRTGIALTILSSLLDNTYWEIPWGHKFFDHPNTEEWMERGVYFNIPFRQGLTIFGLFLHVKADALKRSDSKLSDLTFSGMCWAFGLTAVGLVAAKNFL